MNADMITVLVCINFSLKSANAIPPLWLPKPWPEKQTGIFIGHESSLPDNFMIAKDLPSESPTEPSWTICQ